VSSPALRKVIPVILSNSALRNRQGLLVIALYSGICSTLGGEGVSQILGGWMVLGIFRRAKPC